MRRLLSDPFEMPLAEVPTVSRFAAHTPHREPESPWGLGAGAKGRFVRDHPPSATSARHGTFAAWIVRYREGTSPSSRT